MNQSKVIYSHYEMIYFYMLIGYSRVSTLEQNSNLQTDALRQAGCEKIFNDKITGSSNERPGLHKVHEILRTGDTLVIWRLDRLGRSLKNLLEWMTWLEKEQVALKSLQENIDTSTSSGKLIFHIFGALAEFEKNLIKERTLAGLASARARGRVGGRPQKLNKDKMGVAIKLYNEGEMTVKKICELVGISKPTLYKYLNVSQTKNE
jgi:DNA invertase Pin-like site-specific DNA recombinase